MARMGPVWRDGTVVRGQRCPATRAMLGNREWFFEVHKSMRGRILCRKRWISVKDWTAEKVVSSGRNISDLFGLDV